MKKGERICRARKKRYLSEKRERERDNNINDSKKEMYRIERVREGEGKKLELKIMSERVKR